MTPITSMTGRATNLVALILTAAIAVVTAFALGNAPIAVLGISAAFVVVGYYGYRSGSELGVVVLACAYMAQNTLVTGAFAGHPWQLDTHLLYFVTVAVISVMGSVRAMLIAFGLGCLHHVTFSLVVPELVYPGITWAQSLARSVAHGALVAFEVAVLVIAINRQNKQTAEIESQKATLQSALDQAEQATRASVASQQAADHVVVEMGERLKSLANRNLDCIITEQFPQNYDVLEKDFNTAIAQLGKTLSTAIRSSKNVDELASGLAVSMDQISTRHRASSSTISQTAEELRQLTTSISQMALDVVDVADTTRQASVDATDEAKVAHDTVASIERVRTSAAEIARVVEVIEDIAFQTNILALNAGVEAARAGAAGDGFAIVAHEVRALAQRVASSSADIKGLIEKSNVDVEQGFSLVRSSEQALRSIVEKVTHVSGTLTNVATNLQQNSDRLSQMSDAVTTVEAHSRSDADQFQSVADAGQTMASIAGELSTTVGAFRLATRDPAVERSTSSDPRAIPGEAARSAVPFGSDGATRISRAG